MNLNSESTPRNNNHFASDSDVITAIKKAPLKYRLQLAAINHYLLLQKEQQRTLKQNVRKILARNTKKKNEILNQSNQIISGERSVSETEVKLASKFLRNEEKNSTDMKKLDFEGIPEYWFRVIMNCKRVSDDVYGNDHPLLKKIAKIEHEANEENSYNFTIKIIFHENEYFHNEILSLRIVMSSEGEEIQRIEASPIQWKEGKNILYRIVQRKQQAKKTGETRFIKKALPNDSFFRIFRSQRPKGDEKQREKIHAEMEEVLDVAVAFRDEILAHHFEHYLGVRKTALDFEPIYEDFGKDQEDNLRNIKLDEELKKLKKLEKKEQKRLQMDAKKFDALRKNEDKKKEGCCVS